MPDVCLLCFWYCWFALFSLKTEREGWHEAPVVQVCHSGFCHFLLLLGENICDVVRNVLTVNVKWPNSSQALDLFVYGVHEHGCY